MVRNSHLGDRADGPFGVDMVADIERPQKQKHDPRRDIGECTLQCQGDRETRRTQYGKDRGGLDAELAQHDDEGDEQDGVANHLTHQGPMVTSRISCATAARKHSAKRSER